MTDGVHILCRPVDELDIPKFTIGLVEAIHSVHSLMQCFARCRILRIHFLGWNEFHESLCSHGPIHLMELADWPGWNSHWGLEAYVTSEFLGTHRAVVCLRHSPIVSCFLGYTSGQILFVVTELAVRRIVPRSGRIGDACTGSSWSGVANHSDATSISEGADHVVAADAI